MTNLTYQSLVDELDKRGLTGSDYELALLIIKIITPIIIDMASEIPEHEYDRNQIKKTKERFMQ